MLSDSLENEEGGCLRNRLQDHLTDQASDNQPMKTDCNSSIDSQHKKHRIWHTLCYALFLVGTALVVFAAARNTLTWHCQRFWGASGDFWETQWSKVYDFCNGDDFTICVIGSYILTFVVYWSIGLAFTLIDITGKPKCLTKFKMQPNKNNPVEAKAVWRVVGLVLFNQVVVGIPYALLAYQLLKLRGCSTGRELPTFERVLLELGVFVLAEEGGFYYSHRLMHHPSLYKYIHKKHHEWTAPIAITAIYAHPLEHLISNLLPPVIGPLIMGSHIATQWLWFIITLLSTLSAHSGYHFPIIPSNEFHDYHHLKFNQNYGVLGILDRLHGTDSIFRASRSYDRHTLFFSTTPMLNSIPDNPKSKVSLED